MLKLFVRITKIAIFISVFAATDQVIGLVLRKLYFNQHTGRMHAMTYVLNDCKADILILGASNAQHSYDPRIIGDSLKMSCYNAGQDGGHSIILQYAQIKAITKRYSPKILILDFHPHNIVHFPGDYDRLYVLTPYYKQNPDLRPFILLRSPFEKVKLISAIYPFNSLIIDVIRYNTNTHAARVKDFEGYIPLERVMEPGMYKSELSRIKPDIDTNMVRSLKNIINICHEKGISLYIVSSPLFRTVDERQIYTSLEAKTSLEIIHNGSVNYIDLTFDTTFVERMNYFADQNHLNEEGARIFTQNLVSKMKTYCIDYKH